MTDLQNITRTSSNLTFTEFVRNVAKDKPSTGNAYMGKVSFSEGLPESYSEGTMTVTVLSDGLIKYTFNSPTDPYSQYECYSVNGETPTQWSKGEGGGGVTDLMVETTWADLVNLRDNSLLIPGMKYRITDYHTTTSQENTQSADHQFDVIVTADDINILNENANAIQHEGDTYFSDCNLNAWELKYSLDNDTYRFSWADETIGTGVIWYMKDEYENETFYDFKNIQFTRWKINKIKQHPQHDLIGTYGQPISYQDTEIEINMVEVDSQDSIMCYTFSYTDSNNKIIDASIFLGFNGYTPNIVTSNSIGIYGELNLTPPSLAVKFGLPNIVFLSKGNGAKFHNNKLGFSCQNLTFGNNCHDVLFENSSRFCIFGKDCYEMNLGSSCEYDIFGNDCRKNRLSEECSYNIFNSHISYNTFMTNFEYNWVNDYIEKCTFFDGIRNCKIEGGTENSKVQYAQILNGVSQQTVSFVQGANYTQIACMDSDGQLVVGTPTIQPLD